MNSEQVVERLKRLKPVSLKVALRDGTDKAVAVPRAGNRWARTQQVLDALPWVSVEAIDKDGRTLGIVEQDADLDDPLDGDTGGDDYIGRLLVEVMRSTMRESRLMTDAAMRAMTDALGAVSEAQKTLAATYEQALRVQALPPPAAEGDEMSNMMRMAMMAYMQQPRQVTTPKETP